MVLKRRFSLPTVILAAVLASLAGCGGSAPSPAEGASTAPATSSSAASTEVAMLPTGKSDLVLPAGRHRSPDGFYPAVVLTVDDGWTSVHRGPDGFDLGRSTEPDGGLLVAMAFLVPTQGTAAAAVDAVRGQITGSSTPVSVTIGGLTADGLDVDGGTGQLVAGAAAGIALDALPDGRVRVVGVDVNGSPLVVAVLVPDRSRWDAVWPDVEAVLNAVEFG